MVFLSWEVAVFILHSDNSEMQDCVRASLGLALVTFALFSFITETEHSFTDLRGVSVHDWMYDTILARDWRALVNAWAVKLPS